MWRRAAQNVTNIGYKSTTWLDSNLNFRPIKLAHTSMPCPNTRTVYYVSLFFFLAVHTAAAVCTGFEYGISLMQDVGDGTHSCKCL